MNSPAESDSPPPIRVAVLGCGAVTEVFHGPALRALEKSGQIQVIHVFDPSPERVSRVGAIFPSASPLPSLSDLAAAALDLVVVASPVQFHAEQTVAALEAGAGVLCEKPMAATALEGRRMIHVANQTGRPLAIGLFRRFLPAACAIQEMLASGVLGRIESTYFQEGYDFNWPAQTPAFFKKQLGGGGVLIDLGVHAVDLLAWWFGHPSSLVYMDDAMGGVEANCDLHMTFTSGIRSRVRLSRDWPLRPFCRIEGERGWVEWEKVEADRLTVQLNGGKFLWNVELRSGSQAGGVSKRAHGWEGAFLAQARNVVDAIRGRQTIHVSGAEGIRSLEIIESCYQNRQLMDLPWLAESERKTAVVLNQRS